MQTPLATNHMLPTLCNKPYLMQQPYDTDKIFIISSKFNLPNFPFDFAQNYATALCYQPYTTTLSIQLMHVTSFMQKSLWNKPHANKLMQQTL